jgi:peptidoglycan/xylan/chitin deacetylase (PgdA/CDA1 family)
MKTSQPDAQPSNENVMLKKIKQTLLGSAQSCGVFTFVQKSTWRRERLLILAYHGIAIDDEHRWNPTLFMHPEFFRSRLKLIEQAGCAVLPLGDAIRRLYAGDLPEGAVALTFDDGTYDFCQHAYPILKEFNFPVTLYLTTFYSHYNRPVFDVMVRYLLWKGQDAPLNLKELTGDALTFQLNTDAARATVFKELYEFSARNRLSAEQKDELIFRLANLVRANYEEVVRKRILHIMTPEEVSRVAAGGVDIQLHTHRHRTPLDRELFLREINDNRKCIQEMTGTVPTHFCYPSGNHQPPFLAWLRESGVESATTCDPAIGTRRSDPLLLPRLVDSSTLSPIEFEGWLAGLSDMIPRRMTGT